VSEFKSQMASGFNYFNPTLSVQDDAVVGIETDQQLLHL
jgi:hypothetical protein